MRTIAIVNQKGGSGKTTTAINLAAVLARRGLRTLLVDLDPQSHCAAGLGVPEERIEYSIGEALLADHDRQIPVDSLVWEVSRNLFLAPSTMRLAALEAPGGGLHQRQDKDRRLASLLRGLGDRFDRCLIDCPPTIGLLTYNALRGAREALIPVETGYLAMKGAQKQWTTIRKLIDRIDHPIAVHMLPTIHNQESRVATDVLRALHREFAGQILPTVIHAHESLREAVSFGQPVVEYAPRSKAREDFEKLAEWLEAHAPPPLPDIVQVEAARRPFMAASTGGFDRPSIQRSAQSTNTEQSPVNASDREAMANRAAEMVQRVRDLALASATRDAQMQNRVAAVLAGTTGDTEKSGTNQTENRRMTASVSTDEQRVAFACYQQPETTSTPEGHRRMSVSAPQLEADADSDATFDASKPKLPALMIEATPLPTYMERTKPEEGVRHMYGAHGTSRGVLFVQPSDAGRCVAVAGEFNGWSPQAHRMRQNHSMGVFELIVPLPPGEHLYRLVIDGRWEADSYNEAQSRNVHGEVNSVVTVTAGMKQPPSILSGMSSMELAARSVSI